jgi:RimJ/RimL family protein N-acetyltransferase
LRGRDANRTDASVLASFRCSDGPRWADDVEGYVRASLEWRDQQPGRVVKVFENDAGNLLAVAAFEPEDLQEPSRGFFLSYLATNLAFQRGGIGRLVVLSLIDHLATLAPGAPLTWLVHPSNMASHALCASINAGEPIPEPDDGFFYEYQITLPTGAGAPGEEERSHGCVPFIEVENGHTRATD